MKKKIYGFVLALLIVNCTLNILPFSASRFFGKDCICQWIQCNFPVNDNVTSFSISSTTIFAGTENNGIYKTTNNGINWIQTQLISSDTKALFSYGYTTYSSCLFSGVFKTTNWGTNWIQTSLGNGYNINCFANFGTWIYAGGVEMNGFVYLTYNEGTNWIQMLSDGGTIYSLDAIDTNVYAGSSFSGGIIYYSTNRGMNWSSFNLYNIGGSTPYSLSVSCYGCVFAGTASTGVFISLDKGMTWSQTSLNNKRVNKVKTVLNSVFAGTQDSGIYCSNDYGQTWANINQGFPLPLTINSLIVVNNYLYAGTNYKTTSIWKRPLLEIINNVKGINSNISETFSLFQNCPNPFNPSTSIKYSVSNIQNVKLIVYDILGKEIATLVDEKQTPGTYEVQFSISQFSDKQLSSGIYFYSLFADGVKIDTKRMVLIK